VIHGFPQAQKSLERIVLSCCHLRGSYQKGGKEKVLRGSSRNRYEFIACDFRGNPRPAVLGGFDTHNFPQAADIYIARLRDLLRKSDNELNLAADFEIGFGEEVQPAVTDIPRLSVEFSSFAPPPKNPHRQAHRESPRFAAFRSIIHQYPLGLGIWRNANIGLGKLQRENPEFLS